VDLSDHKKEVDKVIVDRFVKLQTQREVDLKPSTEETSQEPPEIKPEDRIKMLTSDHIMAARLQSELNSRDLRKAVTKKVRQTRAVRLGRRTRRIAHGKGDEIEADPPLRRGAQLKTSFHKLWKLSPQLAAVLGEDEMSRPQAIKAIWRYIKSHDLLNPVQRQEVLCDDLMKPIFGESMCDGCILLLKRKG
jgi:upstream activation factor subunit UAF30